MCWEAITAIIASLLFVGAVGRMIIWIKDRPQIEALSCSGLWCYTYGDVKGKREIVAIQILLALTLRNIGKEDTVISVIFEKANGISYQANEEIEVKWNKKAIKTTVFVDIPVKDSCLSGDENLSGTLILRPRHHRRLFWGTKELRIKLDIPKNQSIIYHSIHERVG